MGLFSKKPKTSAPDTPAKPAASGSSGKPAKSEPAPRPAKPSKPAKGKRGSVDPVDFLALRSGLLDLKARLEASEQSRATVEARLAALDATTTAMATERPPATGDDVRAHLAELQAQLSTVAETAAAANANAENAAAKATAAATVASNAAAAPIATAAAADPELAARVEQLAAQLAEQMAATPAAAAAPAGPDPEVLARLDQLAARVDTVPDPARLMAVEAQLSELTSRSSEPAAVAAASGPDPDTLARIDELTERVAAVDSFGSQLAQLNARVTAQAEFGAQLGSLRDRIAELSTDTDDRRAAAVAATGDADLRDRVNAIADRIAVNDGVAAQIAQLAERVAANDTSARQATEQVATIEQRLNAVSTELANQVSELGRDIDGLAAQGGQAAQGNVSDELIDALKQSQVKLAAEQARYEIAFRQDLAALAEQVRRSPKG